MRKEGTYRQGNLIKLPWQYTVVNNDTSDYRISENVFLRSDVGMPLVVVSLSKYEVGVEWKDMMGVVHCAFFSPQVLLQYKYAALMTLNDKLNFCWN